MAKAGAPARTAPKGESLRGRLPALGAAEVEGLRRLCAAQLCWPLPNDRMMALAPLRKRQAAGGVFELDGEGTRFAVRLDRNATPAGSPDWSDYTGRARLLAWSLANEQALVQLSEALGVSLVPVAELEGEAGATDAMWLAFSLEDLYEPEAGSAAYYRSGDLRLPAAWLTRLLARAEPLDPDRPQPSLARWQPLPVPVSIACAGPRLAPQEWAALRPGDVLVLGSRKQPPPLHASANGRRWPVASAAEGYRIAGPMQTIPTLLESTAMNDNDAAQGDTAATDPANAADAATRALPVLVEFELGRLESTVGELAGLQPGYVFPLPAFVEGANVTIRANGRVSGRGELVAVGDTLGVRLVSWD
jgi:type III secretion protein Q